MRHSDECLSTLKSSLAFMCILNRLISYLRVLLPTLVVGTASTVAFAQATFRANENGIWESAASWAITSGTDQDGIPDANDNVIIPPNVTVALTSSQACNNFVLQLGGHLVFNRNAFTFTNAFVDNIGGASLFITDQATHQNGGNGNWNANSNWLMSRSPKNDDHVYITNLTNNNTPNTLTGHVLISPEGRLETTNITLGNAATFLYADGIMQVNGTLSFSSSKTIGGGGVISSTGQTNLNNNTLTFVSTANIILQSSNLYGGTTQGTLNNDGKVVFDSGIQNAVLNNRANAYARFQDKDLVNFSLRASNIIGGVDGFANNTVEYACTDGEVRIRITTYNNLILSTSIGAGSVVQGNITVRGDLILNAATAIDWVKVAIGGNFIHNNGNFTNLGSTLVFYGSSDQTFRSAILPLLNIAHMEVNKPSGILDVRNNLQVRGTLSMISGLIHMGNKRLTVGSSTSQTGNLSYTSGYVIGEYEKWINSFSSTHIFPVGVFFENRHIEVTFPSGTQGSVIASFNGSAPGVSGLPVSIGDVTIHNAFSEGNWKLTAANGFSSNGYVIVAKAGGFNSFQFDASDPVRLVIKNPNSITPTHWTSGAQTSGSSNHTTAPKTVSAGGIHVSLSTTDTNKYIELAVGSALNCTVVNAGSISGQTNVCASSSQIYSVPQIAVEGTSDFSWSIAGGGVITGYKKNASDALTAVSPAQASLEGTDYKFIQVLWPAKGTTAAAVSVRERAAGCGYGASTILPVRVNIIAPTGISGRTTVAKGAQGISYSIGGAIPSYTYTWSVTNGSVVGSASGVDLTQVDINWGFLIGEQEVRVTASATGCTAVSPVILKVNVINVINSDTPGSFGDWKNDIKWEGKNTPAATENVRILSGHRIDLDGNKVIRHLYVLGNLSLRGQTIEVTGDLEVTGAIFGPGIIRFTGSNSNIYGTSQNVGTVANPVNIIIINNKTIFGGSNLAGQGSVSIENGTVTNRGSFTLSGDGTTSATGNLTGNGLSAASWINAQGSANLPTLLSVSGEILINGTLNAEALYNTVAYHGATNASIKLPVNNTYHNLVINNTAGVKTLSGAGLGAESTLKIKGDLSLTGVLNVGSAGTTDFDVKNLEFNGTLPQSIMASGTVYRNGNTTDVGFPSLRINNASGVTLGTNMSINATGRTFTLVNGIVHTGANILTILNNAPGAIVGGSAASYVNGKLQRMIPSGSATEYFFPVGKITGQSVYAPAGLMQSTAATLYTIEYFFQPPPNPTSVANDGLSFPGISYASKTEYWDIKPNTTTAQAMPKLYWFNATRSGIKNTTVVPQDLYIAHYNEKTTGLWNFLSANITNSGSGMGSITATVRTGFSMISFGSQGGMNPLPVDLLYLRSNTLSQGIKIEWVSAKEWNFSHYTLEKSENGKDFTPIHTVYVDGMESYNTKIYNYLDTQPYFGANYYRLKTTDVDGKEEYKGVVVSYSGVKGDLQLWPNPTSNTEVNIYNPGTVEGTWLSIHSAAGQEVMKIQMSDKEMRLPVSALPKGLYIIKVWNHLEAKQAKLVIQ